MKNRSTKTRLRLALAFDPCTITFESLEHHHQKEVHVHHEDVLLLDMYTYYTQPYLDEGDE